MWRRSGAMSTDDARLPHHYALLGLTPDAGSDAVKRAWKRAAARWHPDAIPGQPQGRFDAVREARDVLLDADRRAAYDAALQASVDAAVATMSKLHGTQRIAGVVGRVLGVKTAPPEVGRNRRLRLSVGFAEAVRGTGIDVQLGTDVRCEACDGTGTSATGRTLVCGACGGIGEVLTHGLLRSTWSPCAACTNLGWVPEPRCESCAGRGAVVASTQMLVPIPAGTRNGQVLRITGAGEAAPPGGTPGDLLVEVEVRAHAFLSPAGADLRCERPVPFWLALAGGRFDVPTLEGSARIAIPAGTRSGEVLRMAGWGLPTSHGAGDQLVTVRVEWPVRLDPAAAEALCSWAATLPPSAFPESRAFDAELFASRGPTRDNGDAS